MHMSICPLTVFNYHRLLYILSVLMQKIRFKLLKRTKIHKYTSQYHCYVNCLKYPVKVHTLAKYWKNDEFKCRDSQFQTLLVFKNIYFKSTVWSMFVIRCVKNCCPTVLFRYTHMQFNIVYFHCTGLETCYSRAFLKMQKCQPI